MDRVCLFDKGMRTDLISSSALIIDKPCFLYSIILSTYLGLQINNVTGNLLPDVTGNYYYYGVYAGQSSFIREDGLYYIWYSIIYHLYIISAAQGDMYEEYWMQNGGTIYSSYTGYGGATGTALVNDGSSKFIKIYDNYNSNDDSKLFLYLTMGKNYCISYKYAISFSRGIYVLVSSSNLQCFISYRMLNLS